MNIIYIIMLFFDDSNELDRIKKLIMNKGYIIGNELGRGGYAIVYKATNNGTELALKITAVADNNILQDAMNKLSAVTMQQCKLMKLIKKCDTECLNENIACSIDHFVIDNKYLVQLMKLYNSDLEKYIVDINKTGVTDIRNFNDLSTSDPKYISMFYDVTKKIYDAIMSIHAKKLAHGDIKPANILIKVNVSNNIEEVGISDFDTLCMPKQEKCNQEQNTPMYSTQKLIKNPDNIQLKDVQESDIFAFALIILILWFGYTKTIEFVPLPQNAKNKWSDPYRDVFFDEPMRTATLAGIKRSKQDSYANLIRIYGTTRNIEIEKAMNVLNYAIEILTKTTSNQVITSLMNVPFTGGGRIDYYKKYLRYKAEYLTLKNY